MEKEIIQIKADMSVIKTEMKYMNTNFSKLEDLLKNVTLLMEKQSVANNRIKDLEIKEKEFEHRLRAVEDWKIKVVVYATIWATGLSTIVWILIKKFL